jgi:hypothetical protein
MRVPTYLSPSSLALWEKSREAFFLQHLVDIRPPKTPQTNAMSVGASFDAYVKSALHEACFGVGANPQFQFDAIFQEQVEEHIRDWALEAGKYAFECYKKTGAYDELLADLLESKESPKFEFKVVGEVNGVPVLGKPDCRYVHKNGAHVILDWKVNGFCSKYGASPYKGFRLVRDSWDTDEKKPSRNNSQSHGMYIPKDHQGIEIGTHYLEETCQDWADQLSIYGWMLGEKVGDESVVVCIDQLACKPRQGGWPWIRIANHRCRISKPWQTSLALRLQNCWKAIESQHIFDDLTKEENDAHCELLAERAAAHANTDSDMEKWMFEIANSYKAYRTR